MHFNGTPLTRSHMRRLADLLHSLTDIAASALVLSPMVFFLQQQFKRLQRHFWCTSCNKQTMRVVLVAEFVPLRNRSALHAPQQSLERATDVHNCTASKRAIITSNNDNSPSFPDVALPCGLLSRSQLNARWKAPTFWGSDGLSESACGRTACERALGGTSPGRDSASS